MHTAFDWIKAARSRDTHQMYKALPYAALNALARSEISDEEMRQTCSGHVTASSMTAVRRMDRESAISLFSAAVRRGFIDC